jgi:putative transferase (TIGR04331 family)
MKLIKTAIDLKYQKKSSSNLYLGAWCFNKDPNFFNSVKDNNINKYHWDDRDKYKRDFDYLSNLYEKTLKDFSNILNDIHKLERDSNYWRVIIGPWLRFFIDALFDRYECVRYAKEQHIIEKVTIYNYTDREKPPINFKEFYDDFINDEWNEQIFSECIKYQNISYETSNVEIGYNQRNNLRPIKKFTKYLKSTILFYQIYLANKYNNIAVFSPNINILDSIKLQISMQQAPILVLPETEIRRVEYKNRLRENFKKPKKSFGFEDFLNELLYKNIPLSYIESFPAYVKKSLYLYPKNINVIYTANAYQSDDMFKIWAAESCAKGSKFVVGQHGGNFGTGLINQTEDHQLKISNSFISWGWKREGYSNIKTLPSIKLSSNSSSYNNSGRILFVMAAFPRFFFCHYSMPIGGQFGQNLKSQILLITKLNKKNFSNLKIRLDDSGSHFGWSLYELFQRHDMEDKIDTSNKPLMSNLANFNLCVCNNNATVFLETLAINYPTIIYLDPLYYEIRPEATKLFDTLKECGILHKDSESASKFINYISHDISKWWLSTKVQNARLSFVRHFASSSSRKSSLKKLSLFLKELQ